MTDASGTAPTGTPTTTWVYDARGRVTGETKYIGTVSFTTGWAYNSADQVTSMTYPDGEVLTYTYLPQMTLDQVYSPDLYYVSDTDYDEAGRITAMTLGPNIADEPTVIPATIDYDYNDWSTSGGRLASLTASANAFALQGFNYTYDLDGNITSIVDTVNTQTQTFTYDALNRLASAQATGSGTGGLYRVRYYQYDASGNLVSKEGSSLGYGTQAANCPDGALSKPHAAVSAGSNQYCYDANGSQTRRITAGANQVTNPGFESSGSWNETRDVNFPGTSFLRSTGAIADEQTDSYGYAISNLAYGYLESASIAVTGDTDYNLFAYLRGELDTEDSESGGWIVRAMFYDANNTALPSPNQYANAASGSAGSLTTTWTQKGGQIRTPANAAFVRVRLYNYYNSGWAAFDDVSLVKVGTSTNLAVNPGFESSSSWTEVRNSSFPATAFWRGTGATASPRNGTYAYAISNHATGKLISNPITVTASSTYSLSAWLRGELDAEGSEGGGWNIKLCTYDVDQVLLGCTSAASGGPGTLTTAWAQKSGTVSTPAGAVQARIQLSLEQGSGWAAFDDVSLVKVGNTTNLAPTPGFESTGGWSTSRDASFPGTSFYRSIWGTADGRSGDYGHVISSHMYGYLQSSAISATPGGVYDVYSWVRGELDADDSEGSWALRVTFYNASGTQISSSDAASGGPTTLTTAWQRKGGQVTAPANTASLKIWLMVYMNSGWAAFDDVSVTQPQTAALTYDAENRLVSVSGSGMMASFVYDGDGNRVQSTINGVTTVYIGNYYEKSGANITKYYYAGAMRVAMKSGSATTWLLGDHLGSTSLAVNGATGQESSEQRYMPFGAVRYTSSALPTKYTFTGQYSNVADFGLMYYNARFYDPVLGRFSSADAIVPQPGNPQSWDRYSYTLNNPVKYTDPSGHMVDDDTQGGCGWITTPPPEPTPTPTPSPTPILNPVTPAIPTINPYGWVNPIQVPTQIPVIKPANTPHPPAIIGDPEVPKPHLLIGFSPSRDDFGNVQWTSLEFLFGKNANASYTGGGYGASLGTGANAAVYVAAIYNLDNASDWAGEVKMEGCTVSLGPIGVTAGAIHGVYSNSPGGLFIGYAPGARVSCYINIGISTMTYEWK